MLKTTAQPLLFAIMASATLAACGQPSTSVSKTLPNYGMTVVDKQTLAAVNCNVAESKIVCDPPKDDPAQSKLDNLNRQQKLAADRKVAIDKVEASIRAALKLQKFNPNAKLDPQKFDESLVAESANQQTKAKSLKDDSLAEQDYVTILGYHCEALHDQKGTSASSTGDILMASPQPIAIKDEAASFVANIGLAEPNNQISYLLADHVDQTQRKFAAALQTDAEFILATSASPQSSVNCSHLRKAGSATPFSDRIAVQTVYDCVIKSTSGATVETTPFVIAVAASEKNVHFEMVPANDLASTKYSLQASALDGFLNVNIATAASNKMVAQAKIPNSARSLRVSVDSNDGNNIALSCAAKK